MAHINLKIQEWIHALEEGKGARVVRIFVTLLALILLGALYDFREFQNLSTPEAMDAAQVARNLSRGEGFVTQFVRPLSIHLIEEHGAPSQPLDAARLKGPHPDLANAPLYPLFLAGMMKVLPFEFEIPTDRRVRVCQPDVLITLVNQLLFIGVVLLVFQLAKRLFDTAVAWTSALLLAGTELLWRLSASGLPTILLMLWFLALAWTLASMDSAAREGNRGPRWLLGMAFLAGAIVGLAALTRYSFGWLLLPVGLYFALFFPGRRLQLCLVATAAFLLLLGPWIWRNLELSGTPFGIAGFAPLRDTLLYPGYTLDRSLQPGLDSIPFYELARKIVTGLPELITRQLPQLGGNWIAAFFLVGLMVGFRSPTLNRLRIFLLLVILALIPVQAILRTEPPAGFPETFTDNLLVVTAPLVFLFGAALFHLLLEQLSWAHGPWKLLTVGGVICALCSPLGLALLPPRPTPFAHPPYLPPLVRLFSEYMPSEDLLMSDVPWAVAWYGDRKCIWTTLRANDQQGREDFFAVNDFRKTVTALYLSPATLNSPLFSQVLEPPQTSLTWARFAADAMMRTNLPSGFPLRRAHGGYATIGHLFLSDRDRWNPR